MIEIDAKSELKDRLVVSIPRLNVSGYTMESVRVRYEWKPPRCDECMVFGHSCDECPKKPRVNQNQPKDVQEEGFQTV